MGNRDEALALRSLAAALEASNELIRQIIARVDALDDRVNALTKSVADHAALHDEGGE